VTNSQIYPDIVSDYTAFVTSFGSSADASLFSCEQSGIICSRNSGQFTMRSFIYRTEQTGCPSVIPNFFSQVVSFTLSGIRCNTLTFSTAFPNLEYLELSNNQLKASFLQTNFASFFPKLQSLVLNLNDFSSNTNLFQNIPSTLKYLNLDDSNIAKVDFAVGAAQGLQELSVSERYWQAYTQKLDVGNLPSSLENLYISSFGGSTLIVNENKTSLDLSSLSNLVILNLWGCSFNRSVQLVFPQSIQSLKFQLCWLSQSFSPSNLYQLSSLQTLYIRLPSGYGCDNYYFASGFSGNDQDLVSLTNLRELVVLYSQVDFALNWLPTSLQKLSFWNVQPSSSNIYSIDFGAFKNLTYLSFISTNFPVTGVVFSFPPNIQELQFDQCNLQHVYGLSSATSTLEVLRLSRMNLFYSSSLNNIIFSRLSKVFLSSLNLDYIPNSFASLSLSVTAIRFEDMYKPTLPLQFHLNTVNISDNVRVLSLARCYFLSLPKFTANSKLIHFHAVGSSATYFLGLQEIMTALPLNLKVSILRIDLCSFSSVYISGQRIFERPFDIRLSQSFPIHVLSRSSK
jgi:hypothetical protein